MADTKQQIALVEAQIAALQERLKAPTVPAAQSESAVPAYSFDISTPAKKAAVSSLGGLLGIGDVAFNLPSNIAAGGSALYESLIGGKPFGSEFQARREQLAQAKELYRQEAAKAGLSVDLPLLGEVPITELAAAIKGPIPKAILPVKGAGLLPNVVRTGVGGGTLGALQAGTAVEVPPEQIGQAVGVGGLLGGALGGATTVVPAVVKAGVQAPAKVLDYALSEVGLGSKQRLAKKLTEDVAQYSTDVVTDPSVSKRAYGEALKANIIEAGQKAKNESTAAFSDKDVYNATVDVRGLRKGIRDIIGKWQRTSTTEIQDANLRKQIDRLKTLQKPATTEVTTSPIIDPETGAPIVTTKEIPAVNTANLGTIHEIQVAVGDSLPTGKPDTWTPEQALAAKLYNHLNQVIENTPNSGKLAAAKEKYRTYFQNFVFNSATGKKAPLAKSRLPEAPEKVVDYVSGASNRIDAAQKAPGVSLDLVRNQKVNEFAALSTAEQKLKWIQNNRPKLGTATWWAPFEEYAQALEGTIKKAPTGKTTGVYEFGKNIVKSLLPTEAGIPTTRFNRTLTQRLIGEGLTQALPGIVQALPEMGVSQLITGLGREAVGKSISPSVTTPIVNDKKAQIAQVEQAIEELKKQIEAKTKGQPTQVSALIQQQSPLVKAVIETESKGKAQAKSGKGATGLMQLMPSTAKALGVDPTDPAQNIEGGKKYLAQMQEQFKNDKLALAAYNWGPANVKKAITKARKAGLKPTWENILQVAYVPAETRKYVSKVLTLKNKYNA